MQQENRNFSIYVSTNFSIYFSAILWLSRCAELPTVEAEAKVEIYSRNIVRHSWNLSRSRDVNFKDCSAGFVGEKQQWFQLLSLLSSVSSSKIWSRTTFSFSVHSLSASSTKCISLTFIAPAASSIVLREGNFEIFPIVELYFHQTVSTGHFHQRQRRLLQSLKRCCGQAWCFVHTTKPTTRTNS